MTNCWKRSAKSQSYRNLSEKTSKKMNKSPKEARKGGRFHPAEGRPPGLVGYMWVNSCCRMTSFHLSFCTTVSVRLVFSLHPEVDVMWISVSAAASADLSPRSGLFSTLKHLFFIFSAAFLKKPILKCSFLNDHVM